MRTNWKQTTLGDVCSLITDGKHGDCADESNSGYFFISAKDILNGTIDYSRARQITREDFEDTDRRTNLQVGDVLVTNSGTIGRIALISENENVRRTTFQKSVAILKPLRNRIESQYLYYYLLAYNKAVVAAAGGTTQQNLLLGDLRRFSIQIHSTAEQKAIAGVLSSLDDKIDLLRRQNKTLENIAQAIFKEWFVNFTINCKKLKLNPKTNLPSGWRMSTLEDVLELAYGKALKEEDRAGSGYPVIGSSGIVGYHNEFLAKAFGIVVGRKGCMGSVIWVEDNFFPIDTTFYVIDKLGVAELFFHLMLLKNTDFQRIGSDSAVPGLNRSMAYSLELVLPKTEVIADYNNTVRPLFEKIKNNNVQIRTLSKLRDTLLPKLMKGEIRVNTPVDSQD